MNQYRKTPRPYLEIAVEHILSCFIFADTDENREVAIENRLVFLETLQRIIPDYQQMLLEYCETYIERWMEDYDVTQKEQKDLEQVAIQVK